jgi:uncharacterized coiled-coil protein SlyX
MEPNKRIEQLEAKTAAQEAMIAHYEKKLGIGQDEVPLEIQGLFAYQKLLKQQIKHVGEFLLTDGVVSGKKSEDALWERTEKMHTELPEKITALAKLRVDLKLEYDENEGKPKTGAISPQNVASLIE